jgi:hypothetical protein
VLLAAASAVSIPGMLYLERRLPPAAISPTRARAPDRT